MIVTLMVTMIVSIVAMIAMIMTISVKPFGCMPSAAVSDGVQSKITDLYPEAIFLPIETTGDGVLVEAGHPLDRLTHENL